MIPPETTDDSPPDSPTTEDSSAPAIHPRFDDAIVSRLLLAGEALAAPLREADRLRDRAPHAVSSDATTVGDDAGGWIVDIARHAAMRMAEDPARNDLPISVCEVLGDGQALELLFRSFLPGRKPPVLLDTEGKPILTRRQVEILREASRDLSHAEIADNLGVSPRTVSTHMERIYRRLGVTKPMQAVARAIAMGYLNLNAVEFVRAAAGSGFRDFSTLHAMLELVDSGEPIAGSASLLRLAQFGLLLTLAAASATIILKTDAIAETAMVGVVCRLDRNGNVREAFGGDRLRAARGIAVAPPYAERHGFVPGAVYVANAALAQHELNSAEIVEFVRSDSGTYCAARRFTGGRDVATRLAEPTCVVFDRHGRLLVTSGQLTDAVLAFTNGGARVDRLATARATQIAIGPEGELYATCRDHSGSHVRLLADHNDTIMNGNVAAAPPTMVYHGLAVSPTGTIYAVRVDRGRGAIEAYNTAGDPVGLFTRTGLREAMLCMDQAGCILAPCPASGDIKVFAPDGSAVRRIPLEGIMTPYAMANGSDGSVWVCGQAE